MKENNLKDFLGLKDVKEKELILCNDKLKYPSKNTLKKDMRLIKKLIDATDGRFIIYFDGRYVDFPYDGLEFKSEKEEFFFNNWNSYIVFVDDTGFKVRFKIKWMEMLPYEKVYKLVEIGYYYTKAHPEVSKYKLY